MSAFKVVLLDHGYGSICHEREIIEKAGGEFIDAEPLLLPERLSLCAEADGILCRRMDITAEMIKVFKRCKVIVRYGVGTDNIDTKAATYAGIIVGHVPVYCVDEVTTHAFALLLACVRKLVATHKRMEKGEWDVHREEQIHRLAGKSIGLVGFGNIGQGMAKKLAGWNLRIRATDPFVEPAKAKALGVELTSFETLCRESDFVSLHSPLLPETHHLICEKSLTWMKTGSILVNTARGSIVDSKALVHALDSGHLALAGLDVFEEEPLPADSSLRSHPRVILTDHTAWYSEESQMELQGLAAREVVKVCTGRLPESLANPEVIARLNRQSEWAPNDTMRWKLKRLEQMGLTEL